MHWRRIIHIALYEYHIMTPALERLKEYARHPTRSLVVGTRMG